MNYQNHFEQILVQLPVILLGLLVGLGLVLVSSGSPVKAFNPGIKTPTAPPSLEHPPEPSSSSFETHFTTEPAMPTPNDVIQITVGGEWPDSCVPRYQSHQIEGNVIRINTLALPCYLCACFYVISPWSFTIEVGPLPIGLYIVEVIGSVYKTTTLIVATERLYLPVILRNL